jgi:hypothetical protein
MKSPSTKPHKDTLSIDFIFVILRVALWMIFRRSETMNCREEFYIRVCDCGRIHVESRHFRLSFQPAEFVALLRRASGIGLLSGGLSSKHHQAMSRDLDAGTIIHYSFSGEGVYGASRVD